MNSDLTLLHPYPFEKIQTYLDGTVGNSTLKPISLSIGEPQHATPQIILNAWSEHASKLQQYPTTIGSTELRECIAHWLNRRFHLNDSICPQTQVLPVCGTREGLFSFAQAVIDRTANQPTVLIPNPFYQIYEGAALLAGAKTHLINSFSVNQFELDLEAIPEETWRNCQLFYLCSPNNPTGAVTPPDKLKQIIELAHQYNFIIASDECYSEIYPNEQEPPTGLLQVSQQMGNPHFQRCVVFHSLSKRSNAPGLRSGFMAGDANILRQCLKYRTYHGCTLSLPTQKASIAAWSDEAHVKVNRDHYRKKFKAVTSILEKHFSVEQPDAGFYLWTKTPMDDRVFMKQLLQQQNVSVVPGQFLARDSAQGNPGSQFVRMALVAPLEQCIEAAHRMVDFTQSTNH